MPIELVVDGDTSWGADARAAFQFINDLETAGATGANIVELIRDTIGTALVAGSGITVTVNDASNTITVASVGEITSSTRTSSYTLALGDAGTAVEMNSASANNLTVPPNTTVAYPVGTVIEAVQIGSGQTTLIAGSGVTLRSSNGLKLRAQNSVASLRQRAINDWVVGGDVTP